MMDNQPSNFDMEPMGEPVMQQPPESPKKKKKGTWKIVLLVLVVALLGSIGGSVLTAAIDSIRQQKQEEVPTIEEAEEEEKKEEEAPSYTLAKYQLPEELRSNDTGKMLDPVAVYEMTVNSVVGIQTEKTTNVFGQEAVAASSGSGFILSEDGYVITNCHVVDGADTIRVSLYSGEEHDAVLVGADSSFDIALLKIEATGLPAVSVGDSDALRVGEEVVAIGNPLGELTFTMTNGILSALDREINTDGTPQNMLQTNAAINSGNSGGPLFDMDGNVIGVTTAKYSGSSSSGTTIEGLGFAIPINDALKVAYDLAEYGYVRGQAYLGVTVRTLDSQTASYYSLPIGPRVETVNPDSCAEKAGIQVGDIIFEFNGKPVENNTALIAALKKSAAGDTVELRVFRAGAELTLTITLDEKPRVVEQPQADTSAQQSPAPGYEFVVPQG